MFSYFINPTNIKPGVHFNAVLSTIINMDAAISWYQKKIGTYDLLIWERAVELQEQKCGGMGIRNKQESSLKPELIDVDLVRGSTFSKTKPQHNVVVLLSMGVIRVLFLPLFFHWWTQQSNGLVFCGLMFLYSSEILCIFLYTTGLPEEFSNVSTSEVALPCILMIVLGLIHSQVVSTNFIVSCDNKHNCETLKKKRTLSMALLEPAKGVHCKQTLSFVTATVRSIDSGKQPIPVNEPGFTTDLEPSINAERGQEFVKERFWNNVHGDHDDTDSSSNECSVASNSDINNCIKKTTPNLSATALLPGNNPSSDHINVHIWEDDQWQKCRASLLDIGSIIVKKVQPLNTISGDNFVIGITFSLAISLLPSVYRIFQLQKTKSLNKSFEFLKLIGISKEITCVTVVVTAVFIQRFLISAMFFVMLCTAQQTFKKRLLYAKYFTHFTSSRRAKKSLVPHFRLNKVHNIKLWLSLRSYLRRRGPQRSVDVIVSSTFLCFICLLCFITVQLLHSSEDFVASLMSYDCITLLLALAIFILHFITTGAKINKKYNCISTLLTEQINLQLQMEKKPHKKEQLQRANNMLTLAAKLIKEIEEPFNIYGLAMNPILYNITRVVLLSAFSGVVSEMLGFKLKIWKIKT